MMFTEGLDESTISWIKQGTDAPPRAAATRLPLAERPPAGQIAALRSPAMHKAAVCGSSLFSPKSLPPVRTRTRHSGLLGRHSVLLAAADSEGDEEESVTSWGVPEDCCYGNFSDTVEEDGVCSSNGADDEVTSQLSRRGSVRWEMLR